MNKILVLCFCFWISVAHAQNKITAVSINRTSCFGKCPSYNLTLTDSGYIRYDGYKDAKFNGFYVGKVSPIKVKKIFAKYRSKKLFSLPDVYRNTMSDISKLHMTLMVNKKIKTIRHAHMGPIYLAQLAKDIDMLIQKEKITWEEGNPDNYPAIDDDDVLRVAPIEVAPKDKDDVFTYVEQMPEFPGGDEALSNYLQSNRKYPPLAAENGIEGKVICSFTVNKEGQINNVKVERGIGFGCDEEAVRVISAMPSWKPGKQNGMVVTVRRSMVVNFHLE